MLEDCDECLKHSYYTRVGLSFSRFFYINYIVFVTRLLIWCLVWMQVHWSEKSSCWKKFLEQWGVKQGSDCHVATSQRRDVPTSRRPHVATSPRRDVPTSRRPHVATSPRRDVPTSGRPHVATSPRRDVPTSRRPHVATSARDLHPII